MSTKIAVLVGSLRKASFSRKVAQTLIAMAPKSVEMTEISLDELAIFNQDFDDEGKPPAAWVTFRHQLATFDAFLFVTPEYNRSMPAVLKNALDVGSRPYGQSKWNGKPAAVVSLSPGSVGGFGSNHHLRQTLVFLNVPTMPQPEVYLGNVASLFNDSGALAVESTRELLQKFLDAFVVWVAKFS